MMKKTTIAVWALIGFTTVIPVLGGLYLYMNRFEYLRLGEIGEGMDRGPAFVRINKFTGERGWTVLIPYRPSSRWGCSESLIKDYIDKN